MVNYKIYALKEISSSELRYVGITKNSLNKRLNDHLRDKKNKHKYNWISKVGKENIEIFLIEENIASIDEICKKEIEYISKYRKEGNRLVNISNGGDGNFNVEFSDEHKMNISKNHANVKGDKNPMYGKTHTKESISKIKDRISQWVEKGGFTESQLNNLKKTRYGSSNPQAILIESQVIEIRRLYENGYTQKKISLMYNMKEPAIYKIVHRINWKHI